MVRFTIWLMLLVFPVGLAAQSTSTWKRIGDATFGDIQSASPGAAYMTMYLRAGTVYQNSNWWTNFVERNRQAVLTLNLNGTFANVQVSKTIVGNPINLQHNRSSVDLGYSGIVVDHLPTTFTGATFNVQINKTARDGLSDIITMVSSLSQAQPPVISVSQQAMGIINVSKSLADYLFSKNLLVTRVQSQSALPAGGLLAPGVYVCMAGDSTTDYQQYLTGQSLKWDGSLLTFNNAPVQAVSYFVIEVGYYSKFFARPLDSLSFGAAKPWAALYLIAEADVPNINDAVSEQKIHDDIQSHLNDARTLLSNDQDLIEDEREAIALAVHDKIQTDMNARVTALGLVQPAAAQAGPQGQPAQQGNRVLLLNVNDQDLVQQHQVNLNQIQLNSRAVRPTAGGPH